MKTKIPTTKLTGETDKEAERKKFNIVHNKGFHITLKNGWTVSVQFGWGNYCDNYNNKPEELKNYGMIPYSSNTAEVWAWKNDVTYPNGPKGYQTPEEVLKFINKVSKKK